MRYINKLDDKDYVTKLSGNNLLLILWERQDLRERMKREISLKKIRSLRLNYPNKCVFSLDWIWKYKWKT